MGYKVLDVYRDLPGTNCADCGKGSCFAFASAVYLDGMALAHCPHLEEVRRSDMERRLAAGREQGEGRRPAANEQALTALLAQVAELDLAARAEPTGGVYREGPPAQIELTFLDGCYRLSRGAVTAVSGEEPTVWVKIFLLIYLTRADPAVPGGRWVAYRELPNTISKSKAFEACAEQIAERFSGAAERLREAATALGGVPETFGSADWVFRFRVLPRVDLLLLYWEGEEEFPARVSLLLPEDVLAYLDQEAIVFMAEAFVARLFGEELSGVVA